MSAVVGQKQIVKGGSFLIEDRRPEDIFTPEDITDEQRMFARAAEEFLRKEVIPREDEIYAKDYNVHRELMLKADAESAGDFAKAGCKQWTYTGSRHGKLVSMPYWSIPDGAFDDPDEMLAWARAALAAGRRAPSKKKAMRGKPQRQ